MTSTQFEVVRAILEENLMSDFPNTSPSYDGPQMRMQPRANRSHLMLVNQVKGAFEGRSDATDEFLRTIVEACAAKVAVLDESGTVLYSSKAWQSIWKEKGVAGNYGSALCFDDCARIVDRTASGIINVTLNDDLLQLRAGAEKEFDRNYYNRGGTEPVYFGIHAARLDLPHDGFRLVITHEDLFDSEDALKKSEERLRQLLEKTKSVVWEAEAESLRFTYVSEQAYEVFGYPLAQWYEPDFLALHIHPDDRQRAVFSFQTQPKIAEEDDFTFRLLSNDGRIVWVHNLVSANYEDGVVKGLRGFMIDISERICAEEALRDLGGRLITAQEEERSRVARELHDDLNQRMALLSIELEQLGEEVRPANLRRRFQALQTQAQEISTDLHRLSYKLHPSKLDHLGLGAAVKSLCDEMSRSRQLKIEVRQKDLPNRLPGDVTLCVFRIIQEALCNCLRHSGAQAVQVVLEKTGSVIRLSVSDNGCGFDTQSPVMKKGLGFISMRERIRIVDGEIHIYSKPHRGTRIEVTVPLKPESNSAAE